MASTNFSPLPAVSAHPHAKPGYGKRSAPDQAPRGSADFVHLRPREAAIAAYIDRLPEGAAIGYKPLAANLADYGQQACGKALRFLSDAGHLRRVKEHLVLEDNSYRWVTRTYFSRTARDDDWWKAYVGGLRGIDLTELERRSRAETRPDADGTGTENGTENGTGIGIEDGRPNPQRTSTAPEPLTAPVASTAPATPEPSTAPATPEPATPEPSTAYRVLARLGRTEPRMTLSAADCSALEALAAEWLARGATPDHITRSLTTGLPQPMHSPGAIARVRLENHMPPLPSSASQPAYISRAVLTCISCDNDETTTLLLRGVCVDCREEMEAYDAAEEAGEIIDAVPDTFRAVPAKAEVARRADQLRALAGLKSRPIPEPVHSEAVRAHATATTATTATTAPVTPVRLPRGTEAE
ncbi:hypothetical protein [Streptomyces sp. NPDC088258]|uniref:hypothetical protein n=1 Tax=Streptomyces sp. NPDC088258 TaxID=3365849 RepID=UPI0037FD719F